jgi:hypothetical protein
VDRPKRTLHFKNIFAAEVTRSSLAGLVIASGFFVMAMAIARYFDRLRVAGDREPLLTAKSEAGEQDNDMRPRPEEFALESKTGPVRLVYLIGNECRR